MKDSFNKAQNPFDFGSSFEDEMFNKKERVFSVDKRTDILRDPDDGIAEEIHVKTQAELDKDTIIKGLILSHYKTDMRRIKYENIRPGLNIIEEEIYDLNWKNRLKNKEYVENWERKTSGKRDDNGDFEYEGINIITLPNLMRANVPIEHTQDNWKIIYQFLITFKYLNNNEDLYKEYRYYLSKFFWWEEGNDMNRFTEWYKKIPSDYEFIEKDLFREKRNIIMNTDYIYSNVCDEDWQATKRYKLSLRSRLTSEHKSLETKAKIMKEGPDAGIKNVTAIANSLGFSSQTVRSVLKSEGVEPDSESKKDENIKNIYVFTKYMLAGNITTLNIKQYIDFEDLYRSWLWFRVDYRQDLPDVNELDYDYAEKAGMIMHIRDILKSYITDKDAKLRAYTKYKYKPEYYINSRLITYNTFKAYLLNKELIWLGDEQISGYDIKDMVDQYNENYIKLTSKTT